MNLRLAPAYIGGVAVEFEPKILNLRVSESLKYSAVELVAGGI